MYQGRQAHGWFGHGTGPGTASTDSEPAQAAAVIEQRIRDIGHTLIAGLPASKRYHNAVRLSDEDRARLTRLLTAVVQALPLGLPAIAHQIFGKHPDTPGIGGFAQAAGLLRNGRDSADLRAATDALGKAAQDIGLDRFKPFLREADEHLAERGGLAVLVRDMPAPELPSTKTPFRMPLPPAPGRIPWGTMIAGAAVAALPAISDLIQRENVKDTIERFGLDVTKPADVTAAYAFLWAENHGPWLFDTPQTGLAMLAMAERVMRAAQADPDLFGRAVAGDEAAQTQFSAVIVGPAPGSGIETRNDAERALVAQMMSQGTNGMEIQTALDHLRAAGKAPTAEERRNMPGVAVMSTPLPRVDGPWLSTHMSDEQGAPIPGQVAERLVGQRFSTFREFREAFWKTVAQTPELASEFQKQNLRFMQNGNAPYPPKSEQVIIGSTGELSDRTFELHHDPAIGFGGPVYDLSTIRVVTPKRHDVLSRKGIIR
jgi:hypothetical protein